ncbi:MAG: hypothetical protein NUW37_17135 [Planctomycetes bacterium]|nr:hypothetical protein [Planctomycetota bacterium]
MSQKLVVAVVLSMASLATCSRVGSHEDVADDLNTESAPSDSYSPGSSAGSSISRQTKSNIDWTIETTPDSETEFYQRGAAKIDDSVPETMNNAIRDATKNIEQRLLPAVSGALSEIVSARIRGGVYQVEQRRLDESIPLEYNRAQLGFSSDSGRISPTADGAATVLARAMYDASVADSKTIGKTQYVLLRLEFDALLDSLEGYSVAYITSRNGSTVDIRTDLEQILRQRLGIQIPAPVASETESAE